MIDRRHLLQTSAGGFGYMALAAMFDRERTLLGEQPSDRNIPDTARSHPACRYPVRAKRVVQFFMAGGASQIDLFDYKPELIRRHGQASDFGESVETFQDGLGPWLKPVWEFRPYGASGKMLSDVVAPLGDVVDEIAFVHNMVGSTGVHSQGTLLQSTGFSLPGFPGAGCWVSYALGSMNENLPTFVVLPDHRGLASNGIKNWDSAFLPSTHSGTRIALGTQAPISDLFPHRSANFINADAESATHDLLRRLNRRHALERASDNRLEARIRSYELAAKMQLAAPEALRWEDEPEYVMKAYGIDGGPQAWPAEINVAEEKYYFGQKCLVARRLLERGVRFIQVWSGNDNGFPRRNWDSHEDIERDHGPLAQGMSHGIAAFIKDLKQRGMLDDTLILWTSEFGRMPSSQAGRGRDHNPFVFTNWMCGGGIRGGTTYGESDPFGFKPLDRNKSTTVYDIHATLMKLLGIEHTELTWRHNGIDRRLTDVHGSAIDGILA